MRFYVVLLLLFAFTGAVIQATSSGAPISCESATQDVTEGETTHLTEDGTPIFGDSPPLRLEELVIEDGDPAKLPQNTGYQNILH